MPCFWANVVGRLFLYCSGDICIFLREDTGDVFSHIHCIVILQLHDIYKRFLPFFEV